MTAIVKHSDGFDFLYDASLKNKGETFYWNLSLQRLVESETRTIYEVLNRNWERVGPEFASRSEGSRFLGFEGGRKEAEVAKNWDRLIEEYNDLYSDEIETRQQFHGENLRKFGRPSRGRTERLQFSATPQLATWLASQSQSNESLSNTIFRLLEDLRESGK